MQSVIEPVLPRPNHHLDIAAPELPSPVRLTRRSLGLNSSTLSQHPREEGSIAPLVASYYGTSLVDAPSPPTINPSYNQHAGSTANDSDDYLHGPANVESPPSMSQSTMEFPTSGISANHLQRAASTGVHFNSVQPLRRPEHSWSVRGPHTRWSFTEPSSPAEDTDTTLHRDKVRRSSLKTCELEEAGLDFPGCFVLVPTMATEGSMGSGNTVIEGPEPGLISTKKNIRRPMAESERQAIKLNRRYGVCLRCKMFKEKVYGSIFYNFQQSLTRFSAEGVSLAFAASL